jgi:hypothetical protein
MAEEFEVTHRLEDDNGNLRMITEFPCACGKGTFRLKEGYEYRTSMTTYTADAGCLSCKDKMIDYKFDTETRIVTVARGEKQVGTVPIKTPSEVFPNH